MDDFPLALAEFRFRSCTSKKIYWSLGDAAYMASKTREFSSFEKKGEDVNPYPCIFDTGHWHVGNSSPYMVGFVAEMKRMLEEYNASHAA